MFYLLSHGGATDAFWIDWNAGATKACEQLNVTCKISFSGGDMAAQKEAFNSAIAAHPDGIATTSVQPGLWTKEVAAAKAADNYGAVSGETPIRQPHRSGMPSNILKDLRRVALINVIVVVRRRGCGAAGRQRRRQIHADQGDFRRASDRAD